MIKPFPPVLRTKIIPPPRNARTLPRPRVSDLLRSALDYRLTILQAGAGYGKSTALAELAAEIKPLVWYQVNDEDNDPLVFLLHLLHATHEALPEVTDLPISYLEAWDGTQGILPWRNILDQLINVLSRQVAQPVIFVFDDVHEAIDSGEVAHILDRFIGLAPASVHVLLSGRPTITLPNLSRWRSQGEVLTLDQHTLTFTVPEIATLFSNQYHLDLTSEEVESLLTYTEGWAIALQLIWQSIRNHSSAAFEFPLHWQADSLESLFDVLAQEVFSRHPADIRDFLLITSTLRDLNPEACDALRRMMGNPASDSTSMLAYLRRQDLFVVETAEGTLRYHHIFHNFLRQQCATDQRAQWNRAAADYYLSHKNPESAIYHQLEAQAWDDMADMLDAYSQPLLSSGRFDTLAMYIASLPPLSLNQHPMLLFTLGELARLHSRFDESQGWYRQAETVWRSRGQQDGIARALRGQARVYLDTVNPSEAEKLLEEAIRLSDGFEDREAQVRLFELLAENKLNSGHVEEAERLRQRAEELRLEGPSNDQLLFRVWLRTGKLNEARRGLEDQAEAEKHQPVQTPRAHRETHLILSLIYSFQGLGDLAFQSAQDGTRRGNELKSPFVTAVGHMRQGHALMLASGNNYTWDELAPHLRYSEKRPNAIPWEFKYYERSWGFCLPKNTFDKLPRDKKYHAVIHSEFCTDPESGMKVSVGVIHPEGGVNPEAGEFILQSHTCHPAQANDDGSGIVCEIELARRFAENPLPAGSMSIRFWFGPETIGTVAYLANHEDLIPNLRGGMFIDCAGSQSQIAFQRTRQDTHLLDRITKQVLTKYRKDFREGEFAMVAPNDERIINGAGVNVPSISLSRFPYPEYHTSDDNIDIIDEDLLLEIVDITEEIIRIYASNYIPKRTFRRPVFLSGYGLWVDWRENWDLNRAIEKIMMKFEGDHTVFDIAEQVSLDYWVVREYVEKFRAKGFVKALPIPSEAQTD